MGGTNPPKPPSYKLELIIFSFIMSCGGTHSVHISVSLRASPLSSLVFTIVRTPCTPHNNLVPHPHSSGVPRQIVVWSSFLVETLEVPTGPLMSPLVSRPGGFKGGEAPLTCRRQGNCAAIMARGLAYVPINLNFISQKPIKVPILWSRHTNLWSRGYF